MVIYFIMARSARLYTFPIMYKIYKSFEKSLKLKHIEIIMINELTSMVPNY